MAKYIDWYLVEAESLLTGRLRQDKLHDMLVETEAHLRDTAEDLAANGMTENDAQLAAIQRFGNVQTFANDVADPRKRKLWPRLIAVGGFLFACVTVVGWTASHSPLRIGPEALGAWYAVVVLAAVLFMAGGWLARRWRGRLVLGSLLLGCAVGFLLAWPLGSYMSAVEAANDLEHAQVAVKEIDGEAAKLHRGMTAFASSDPSAMKEFMSSSKYLVPIRVVPAILQHDDRQRDGSIVHYAQEIDMQYAVNYESVPLLNSARYLWRQNSEELETKLLEDRTTVSAYVGSFRATANDRLSREGLAQSGQGVFMGVFASLLALAVQWLISLVRVRRSWLRQRLA